MQPQLLEFNFGPDNTRLIRYYPNFLNEVFGTLFLDNIEDRNVVVLA
jgi:tubulin--tyrosine ligase-like protein 12